MDCYINSLQRKPAASRDDPVDSCVFEASDDYAKGIEIVLIEHR